MIQIIYINGPSSVGKTTLARSLQALGRELWLHIGIDRMIAMMPTKANDWREGIDRNSRTDNPVGFCWHATKDCDGKPIHTLVRGTFVEQLNHTFHAIIQAMARQGNYIIIDDVARLEEVQQWRNVLCDYNVLYVGLTAPLEVLEVREFTRGDRAIGSSRSQLAVLHKDVHYDLFFDSSTLTTEDMVQQIIAKL